MTSTNLNFANRVVFCRPLRRLFFLLDSDPAVARFALTAGYSLSQLRCEIAP
jgi:hypothetical protein